VIVSSILAFLAYLYALQKLPTNLVSIYAYINPLVAVISGNIFIGEPLTGLIIGGAMVTLLGVYIVNISLRRVKIAIVPPVEKTH
jgi:drug/metabolite transporter (DMT)-like permease